MGRFTAAFFTDTQAGDDIEWTKEAMALEPSWQSFLEVLPPWMREPVDRLGRDSLSQLRLRLGQPPRLEFFQGTWLLSRSVTEGDLEHCINAASRYSPWSQDSARQGYLSVEGGHRIGVCGRTVVKNGQVTGFQAVTSLCLRVARDKKGLVGPECADWGSILIIGAPGWGKTTLLREICRELAMEHSVGVVDERGELFPKGFSRGRGLDVLSGCGKEIGMEMVLRTMAPDYIAVDEITAKADALALRQAVGCGVGLLATAHAENFTDLSARPCYRGLTEKGIFDTVLVLRRDKTYHRERMETWSTNGLERSWSSAAAAASASPWQKMP